VIARVVAFDLANGLGYAEAEGVAEQVRFVIPKRADGSLDEPLLTKAIALGLYKLDRRGRRQYAEAQYPFHVVG